MILTDIQIRDLCKKEKMIFPFKEESLQSESYDLSIGETLYVNNSNLRELDLKDEKTMDNLHRELRIPDDGFVINPKEYVLVSLNENLNIPENINAHIRPRTRFIRSGLYVSDQNCNSSYSGILRIGLFNFLDIPIRIYKGMKVCQIIFEELKSTPSGEKQYKNKINATYQNEKEFIGPKLDPELRKKVDAVLKEILGD